MSFRELTRIKQKLENKEYIEILKNEKRGVLSVLGDDDYPYCIPMNYFYDEKENKLYFHGSRKGHKIDSINKHNKVCFCVCDSGSESDKDSKKFGLNFKSVVVFGKVNFIEDYEKTIDICRKISSKFDFGEEYTENEIKQFGRFVLCFEIQIEHISGKIVNES